MSILSASRGQLARRYGVSGNVTHYTRDLARGNELGLNVCGVQLGVAPVAEYTHGFTLSKPSSSLGQGSRALRHDYPGRVFEFIQNVWTLRGPNFP